MFVYGEFELLSPQDESVAVYKRTYDSNAALVVLNFSPDKANWKSPEGRRDITRLLDAGRVVVKNYDHVSIKGDAIELRTFEAVVFYE